MPEKREKREASPSAREAAYQALLAFKSNGIFLADTLSAWMQKTLPSPKDTALAREIAYGSCRMALALDNLAAQCASEGKLSLKTKERLLLHTALYQHFFLKKIPLYAIVDESVRIARQRCHTRFASFLNAVLRSLERRRLELPQGKSVSDLSIRYSYPPFFIERLIQAYGLEASTSILEAGNMSAPTMFRVRSEEALGKLPENTYRLEMSTNGKVAVLLDTSFLEGVAASAGLYIQNGTPAVLMHFLKEGFKEPRRILDLCASPGGKLLLAYDFFPQAQLYANDVSPQKIDRLANNLSKYGVEAVLSSGPGEEYEDKALFDLIILDVPCSNTGVLNKRPEARWRLSNEHLSDLQITQKMLLSRARQLLAPGGEIWYLTCSILPEENEKVIESARETLGLSSRKMETILPNSSGWDGGFACALCEGERNT